MRFCHTSIVLLITTAVSFAGFKLPSSVFTSNKITEASAKAKEEGKALAFVYTDAGST